ncbi:MAG: T9SS type A sorting domain-containing protein [Chitinophagaceae bacterium]|nr:T9SS type A sorting domain-containing protein [Chitinophagaceae bacterium]
MKSNSKIKQLLTRSLLASSVLFCSLHGMAQQGRAVMADPKLGTISFTDMAGFQLDEAYIQPNELVKLKIPVLNNSHGQALPAGSCKIKIGFGSKLVLDPSFDLNATAMNSYFQWSSSMNSGQLQITGELIEALPANITNVEVALKVKGTVVGKSTITANFLITNHNTFTVLSDEDGTNNSSFLQYTVTNRQAPVSVTTITDVVKEGCSLNVSFSTDREINLVKYEVEISKDGASFEKVASLSAAGNLSYNASFEIPSGLQVDKLFVRIKSVERNGKILYSNVKNTNGLCKVQPVKLSVYPSPASGVDKVMIAAAQGSFNGKYKVKMMDMSGKTVLVKDVSLAGVQNFPLELVNIAAGKYLIQMSTADNVQIGLLKFEKL